MSKLKFKVVVSQVEKVEKDLLLGDGSTVRASVPERVVHLVADGHSEVGGSLKISVGDSPEHAELFAVGAGVVATFSKEG